MADSPKTVPTDADVAAFVAAVKSPVRRRDAETLLEIMGRVTGLPPVMWGPSIIGFGEYHYRYATGREGVMAAAGFSPRATSSTVYLADGFDQHGDLLARLGPHTTGASCLYLKDLTKVDVGVLEDLIAASFAAVSARGAVAFTADGTPPKGRRSTDRSPRAATRQTVKVANDYGCPWPLWNSSGPMEHDEIDMPESLRARLLAWVKKFNEHFHWEHGWDSPDLSEPHAREGRALRDDLAAHLGPGYDVKLSVWESGVPD